MKHRLLAVLMITSVGLTFTAGCQTDKQNKALIGSAVGAGVGYAITGDAKGTAIGAGVGAGTGYVVGKDEPKQQTPPPQQGYTQPPQQNYQGSSAGASTVSVWVTNSNGSQSEVKLTRNPDGSYTGPKGERYQSMPTENQLQKAYGF